MSEMSNYRVVSIGIGNMGSVAARSIIDHGYHLVGACDIDLAKVGKDVGEFVGREAIGIAIVEDLDKMLDAAGNADVAVVCTESTVFQNMPIVKKCAERGINVITIAEEVLFPWTTSPELSQEIDGFAKEHGITVIGSGVQDVFNFNLASDIMASCNCIDRVECENLLALNDMGPVVCAELLIGKTVEEFDAANDGVDPAEDPLAGGALTPCYVVCDFLDLHPLPAVITKEPIIAQEDVYVESWDQTIEKGTLIGINGIGEMDTEEGITFKVKLIFKVISDPEAETPYIRWSVEGDPSLSLFIEDIKGEVTTSYDAVNRIPDAVAADPGLKTISQLPKIKFYPVRG